MIPVIILRLITPPVILRFPLFGAILAVIIDYLDYGIFKLFTNNNLASYQLIDKSMDMYYLAFEVYISSSFENILVKRILIALFLYRLLGYFLFLATQLPIFLVIFFNLFEAFFLFYLISLKLFKKDFITSIRKILPLLLILAILKVVHEYLLHINSTNPWTENIYVKRLLWSLASLGS